MITNFSEHMNYQLTNEFNLVNFLLDSIRCTDLVINADISMVLAGTTF